MVLFLISIFTLALALFISAMLDQYCEDKYYETYPLLYLEQLVKGDDDVLD